MEIHVDTSELDRYIADLKTARQKVRKALGDVARTTAKDGNQAGKNFARVSAGRHGKRYPKAWTVERISATEYVYGPDASMPQGGMSFETGSRNQKPHLDGARSADLIEAVFGGRVERALGAVLDEALG